MSVNGLPGRGRSTPVRRVIAVTLPTVAVVGPLGTQEG